MKKIISIILAALMMTTSSAFASYIDVSTNDSYAASVLRLQDLGIISGYEDGSFRPGGSITRAEFTKIVVCMMDKEKEAAAKSTSSGFFDVAKGSWSAPYINYAVSQNILSGYSDGSFGPDKTISFSEAVTILLRTLSYTEEEVGYYWPDNYLSAGASLGMTAELCYDKNQPLSRADAAVLVDRALFTKPAAQNGNTDTYLETIGCTVLDDALILDTDSVNGSVSVLSGNLKLNSASSYITKTQTALSAGDTFQYAVIDKNGYLKAVRGFDGESGIYSLASAVTKLSGNTIEYTSPNGGRGSYRAEDDFVTYAGGSKMLFASAKQNITPGVDITFYGSAPGIWSIAVVGSANDIDPVLASKNYTENDPTLEGMTINKEGLTVYRNGEASKLSDIKVNDVVYYNTKTNVMEVYSKKVTGVYYSASPSKAYIESVTVGGKSYDIGYSAAAARLDASAGAFEIGDRVTLLLGKNNEVAFCVDNASGFDYSSYGVLLGHSSRIAEEGANEGSTEIVASIFTASGETQEIVVDRKYENYIGDLVRIAYSGGVATLTKLSSATDMTKYEGAIDQNERTIDSRYVLEDAAIIQRTSAEDASVASCELLDFKNLTASKLSVAEIINVVTANGFEDIAILYVKNLESTCDYGVISGFVKGGAENETVGYKIFDGSTATEYNLNNVGKISTAIGNAVGYTAQGGQLSTLSPLNKIGSGNKIGAVDGGRIMLDGTIYKMGADVKVIKISGTSTMQAISIDDLSELKDFSAVTLWSDKTLLGGGQVRVVTVK